MSSYTMSADSGKFGVQHGTPTPGNKYQLSVALGLYGYTVSAPNVQQGYLLNVPTSYRLNAETGFINLKD